MISPESKIMILWEAFILYYFPEVFYCGFIAGITFRNKLFFITFQGEFYMIMFKKLMRTFSTMEYHVCLKVGLEVVNLKSVLVP